MNKWRHNVTCDPINGRANANRYIRPYHWNIRSLNVNKMLRFVIYDKIRYECKTHVHGGCVTPVVLSFAPGDSYLQLCLVMKSYALQWRHNRRDSVSIHPPHDCLCNRLFRRKSKKTPVTGEFPAQMASNAENVSIWWRHHGIVAILCLLVPWLLL